VFAQLGIQEGFGLFSL